MLIRELILETRDLAAQASFWAKTLALPTAVSEQSVEVRLRHSTIRFKCAATGANPRYHFAINIPRGSIEDAATWLERRHDVLAFHGDPDVADGATIVRTDRGAATLYFLDAVGNVVELIANDHLDSDSGEPFGPDSLLERGNRYCDRRHRGHASRGPGGAGRGCALGRTGGLAAHRNRR